MIGALFHCARKLRKRNHRDIEFTSQPLQAPRDLRDLIHARILPATTHELEVIDDQQVEPFLGLESARLGADVHDCGTRSVIDVDRRFRKSTKGV